MGQNRHSACFVRACVQHALPVGHDPQLDHQDRLPANPTQQR
jgi:hypothetical protein